MKALTNNEIRFIRSLKEKKFRDLHSLFTVEGEKMVAEAERSSFTVRSVYRRDEIGEDAMGRISQMSSPSPVLAVVEQKNCGEPEAFISSLLSSAPGLCLALDSVRDPGNFGTILRLADWYGIETVFASRDSVELYNPKVIQSSMGAVFRVKVCYCDIAEVCTAFSAAGIEVFGTFLNGENLYRTELPGNALIVMGNESEGISGRVSETVTRRLTIPSFAAGTGPESLNVAVAASIVVSEFRRRTCM